MNEEDRQKSDTSLHQAPAEETAQPRTQPSNPLQGVGGWLRFFVVVRIYLDPIFTALTFILAWIGYVSLADRYGGGIIVSGFVDTAIGIALTVRGIQVGIRLRDIRPRAVQAAKGWLWLVLVWAAISPAASRAFGFPEALLVPGVVKAVAQTLISFGIWYSYFNVSKRVKATYSDWQLTREEEQRRRQSRACCWSCRHFVIRGWLDRTKGYCRYHAKKMLAYRGCENYERVQ